jgi:hypothetical protein
MSKTDAGIALVALSIVMALAHLEYWGWVLFAGILCIL